MFHRLNVAAVMPPEPVLALDQCYHRIHPSRIFKRLESALQCLLYVVDWYMYRKDEEYALQVLNSLCRLRTR